MLLPGLHAGDGGLHSQGMEIPRVQCMRWFQVKMAVVVKSVLGSQFGWLVNSPPILVGILVGIGMSTGGYWLLTHGQNGGNAGVFFGG